MTTASVYYDRTTGEPSFILIDGDRADVPGDLDYGPDGVHGDRLRLVDAACKALGWRVMNGAPIMRQADGRGTVRIEPVSLRPGLPPVVKPIHDRADDRWTRDTQVPGLTVAVDAGNCVVLHTPERTMTVTAVDGLCNDLRAARDMQDVLPPGDPAPAGTATDWRDTPTIVRISDDAATALNEAAAHLDIPGDVLASTWIVEAAARAHRLTTDRKDTTTA